MRKRQDNVLRCPSEVHQKRKTARECTSLPETVKKQQTNPIKVDPSIHHLLHHTLGRTHNLEKSTYPKCLILIFMISDEKGMNRFT